jgi:hypothetical protein
MGTPMSRSRLRLTAPDKERFIAALKGKQTDRVPYFENLIETGHGAKLLGREGAGNTLGMGGDPAKGPLIPHLDHLASPDCTWDHFKYYRARLNDIIGRIHS